MLKDEYLAYKASLFFAISPSTILFISPVSDSVLAAATFAALFLMEYSGLCVWSGIYFAFATATKVSTIPCGLLYIMYRSMRTVSKETILLVRSQKNKEANLSVFGTMINVTLNALVPGLWNIVLVTAPFGALQWFAHATFCTSETFLQHDFPPEVVRYGQDNNLLMPLALSNSSGKWCDQEPPISYLAVVSKYWKQKDIFHTFFNANHDWPYLIQALPIYALILWQAKSFFLQNTRYCIRLGLIDNALLGLAKIRQQKTSFAARSLPRECFIYMVVALAILAVGAVFVSVQVYCITFQMCKQSTTG